MASRPGYGLDNSKGMCPRGPTQEGGGGGGVVRKRFIFCTPKNLNCRICLPEKDPHLI